MFWFQNKYNYHNTSAEFRTYTEKKHCLKPIDNLITKIIKKLIFLMNYFVL